MNKRVLMVATVPAMIGQFNMSNIRILQGMGYVVDVASDFYDCSVWPMERVQNFKDQLREMGVEAIQIDFSRNPFKFGRQIRAYKKALKLIKERKYTFIHTHTPIASAIIRLVAYRTKTKVIYTAHGFHFYKGAPLKNWLLYYPVEWICSWLTDIIITINKEDYYEAVNKFHAKNVKYVPGVGLDFEKWLNKNRRNCIRCELGIGADEIVVLSVGELSDRKNHSVVIKALGKMQESNVHYIICGAGEKRSYLQELAQKEGIENNVHILGYRRDVNDIYHGSDLFIFPSKQEGLPVALMEAIACKVPVICSNIRGNNDLVCMEEYLFDYRDVCGIEKCIKMAIKDLDKLKNKQKNIYNNLKNFSLSNVRKIMYDVYSSINN